MFSVALRSSRRVSGKKLLIAISMGMTATSATPTKAEFYYSMSCRPSPGTCSIVKIDSATSAFITIGALPRTAFATPGGLAFDSKNNTFLYSLGIGGGVTQISTIDAVTGTLVSTATYNNNLNPSLTTATFITAQEAAAGGDPTIPPRVTALEGTVLVHTDEISTLGTRTAAVESTNATQTSNIAALEGRTTTVEQATVTNSSAIAGVESRTTAVETATQTNSAAITTLQGTTVSNTNRITDVESRTTAVESTNATQTSNIAALDGRTTAVEQATSSNTSRIGAVENRTTTMEQTTTSNTQRIGSVENRTTSVEQATVTNSTAIAGVAGRTVALEEWSAAASRAITSLEFVTQDLTAIATNHETRITTLENAHHDLKKGQQRSDAGVSMALALANVPMVMGKTLSLGVGLGSFNGESGAAVKAQFVPTSNVVVSLGGATGSQGGSAVAGGVSIGW